MKLSPRDIVFRGSLILLVISTMSTAFASHDSVVIDLLFLFGIIGFIISTLVKVFSRDYAPKNDNDS
jgi:positive regulator of sigma E activity